jgi:hypothetical protein
MPIYPCPKPPKKERKPSRLRGRRKSDGEEYLILAGEEWEAQREAVGSEAGFLCSNPKCNRVAPLHELEVDREEGVMPYLIKAGQAAHIIPRRMGGGSRKDFLHNLRWLCWICHHLETIGKLEITW